MGDKEAICAWSLRQYEEIYYGAVNGPSPKKLLNFSWLLGVTLFRVNSSHAFHGTDNFMEMHEEAQVCRNQWTYELHFMEIYDEAFFEYA